MKELILPNGPVADDNRTPALTSLIRDNSLFADLSLAVVAVEVETSFCCVPTHGLPNDAPTNNDLFSLYSWWFGCAIKEGRIERIELSNQQ